MPSSASSRSPRVEAGHQRTRDQPAKKPTMIIPMM
jgi:hypothetical protein